MDGGARVPEAPSMPRSAFVSALLVVPLLAISPACTRRVAAPPAEPAAVGNPSVEIAAAREVVSTFIAAEARGDETADTLISAGADFVATGIAITARPRLAAMIGRGEGTIEEARTELGGGFAWVTVVYRWVGRTPESVERARATFVLERRLAGWKIRHVHSSMVERWE